ncbi:MAG: ferrous iron transport protein A [Chitinophagales bacterium]
MNKKLSQLKPGQKAIIRHFDNEEIHLKLMEMGCLPGEQLTVEQKAPLGDPVSITIAGYTLSLRLNEADHIIVSVID